jgi:hypothetical protein
MTQAQHMQTAQTHFLQARLQLSKHLFASRINARAYAT